MDRMLKYNEWLLIMQINYLLLMKALDNISENNEII